MNDFVVGLLWGLGISVVLVPIGFVVYVKYKNVMMRRSIKRMIKDKKILIPMDKNDYDSEAWKGDIDMDKISAIMPKLNDIFKETKEAKNDGNTTTTDTPGK